MSNNEHIYAVARVKANELNLLDNATIEQLVTAKDLEALNKILSDKGWGDGSELCKNMIVTEKDKLWAFIRELVQDMSIFDTVRVDKDFHNIKAAIKSEYIGIEDDTLYQKNSIIPVKEIKEIVKSKNFSILPDYMENYALEAYEHMFKTGDGQLCDIILDKGCLEAMIILSEKSGNKMLKAYAQTRVAIGNIKIAIRGSKIGKDKKFFEMALVPCRSIDVNILANMAIQGLESIYSYLETTPFRDAIDAIKTDLAVFECWCDNRIINAIKKEKYTPMTISPIIAYILARQNEIRTIRILIVAKRNNLPQEEIRKRMREMYV